MIDQDQLVVLGVVQEQHAERTRLYKQWQQYRWPIVQDALNLMQINIVPLTIAVNETGMVVSHQADPEFLKDWMDQDRGPPAREWSPLEQPTLVSPRQKFLWEGTVGLGDAISAYEQLLGQTDCPPQVHFEVAVCYRQRFETQGNPRDFEKAVEHWSRALQLNPNQYIYRRRIEQYGARLGKPYPFYDWVPQAEMEIRQRGEQPFPLMVPISGAEIAKPQRSFESQGGLQIGRPSRKSRGTNLAGCRFMVWRYRRLSNRVAPAEFMS